MESSAGEAAALFGEPDPATDPFAVAVGKNGQDTFGQDTGDGGEPSQSQESSAASELFNGNSDSVDFFSTAGALNGNVSNQYSAYGGETEVAQGYQADRAATVAGANYSQHYPVQNSQANGYYSEHQAHTVYAHQQPQPYGTPGTSHLMLQATYPEGPPVYDMSYAQPPSTYGSYAPLGATAASAVQPAPASTASASYNPYKPAAQSTSTSFASQAMSAAVSQTSYNPYNPSQSTYDPYKPVQPADTTSNPYNPQNSSNVAPYGTKLESSYAYSLTPAGAPTTRSFAAPPPAPPSAPSAAEVAPYRPKTSNAYDPPLPPPKPSKRVSSHLLFPGSPPGQQVPLSPPPPQAPPRRQASVPTDGYAPSAPSLHRPPPVQRYASPQQSTAYSALPQPSLNGYSTAGHYDAPVEPSNTTPALPQVNHSWDGMPQATSTLQSFDAVVSPQPPAVTPRQVPFSSTSLSEAGLAAAEHGPDPYASAGLSDPSTSHSIVPAYPQTQEPSPYEPQRVASPPQRIVSPPVGNVHPNGSATWPANQGWPHAHTTPERTKSPGSASVRSVQSAKRQSFEQPHRGSVPTSPPTAPRRLTTDSTHKVPANSYDPPLPDSNSKRAASPPTRVSPNAYDPPILMDAGRAGSPPVMTSRPSSVVTGGYDPYTPANNRMRSMSNGSVLSSISAVLEDPYSPSRHVRQQTSDSARSSFERGPGSAYAPHATVVHDAPPQVLSVPHPAQAMYAPSPSLVGANDPLGRTSVRIPVVSFGFGGKLVTCFHGTASSGGFDVALASRYSSEVMLQTLSKVIPESALDSSAASYPGPLFSDPGTPTTTSLVRTAAAQTKTKKARVIKYLDERAEELNRGLGYFHSGSLEGRRAEGKHVLVKLLKVMVENDGRLSGR